MVRRASVKAMTGQRTGRLLAVSAALLAGGCGASFPRSGLLHGGGAIPLVPEGISAEPPYAPLSNVAAGLVAALRKGKVEAIPGFEILITPIVLSNSFGDKPAGYWDASGTGGSAYTAIPWGTAFTFSSSIEFQVVLKRPPRGASSLAAGDTFLLFGLSMDSYTGNDVGALTDDGEDEFGKMSLTGYWIDARTVLDALGADSGWRPYLQYGGGFIKHPGVGRSNLSIGTDLNWSEGWVLGWRMTGGLEWRSGKLGVYVSYGVQAVGAPAVASLAPDKNRREAQDLITYPARIGLSLSF